MSDVEKLQRELESLKRQVDSNESAMRAHTQAQSQVEDTLIEYFLERAMDRNDQLLKAIEDIERRIEEVRQEMAEQQLEEETEEVETESLGEMLRRLSREVKTELSEDTRKMIRSTPTFKFFVEEIRKAKKKKRKSHES